VGKKPSESAKSGSIVNISHLTGKRRGAIVKEEVVQRGTEVVKYSLAYINPRICGVDNGRVLGYDNSHGRHHRHHIGQVSSVNFPGYEALLERFRQEVTELWRREDEQGR
jgi:Family of unknown function (DUF6516)